jgi:4-hydroxy-tetrahydrodipicolinate synthase
MTESNGSDMQEKTMTTARKKGFIPVMLTTFTEEGKVDYDALTRLTEAYLEAGAAGLFANCLSSEMFDLDAEERIGVTRHVVRIARGRVPVVASGTFSTDNGSQAAFIRRIHDTGVQAVIILSNMLAAEKEPDRVFQDNFRRLLDATGEIPLGFYECPTPYKRLVGGALLGECVRTGRLIYHKDTCCDIGQVRDKLQQTQAHADRFGLYDAFMGHAVDTLRAGSAGLSCIQGNLWPELVTWLCNHAENPDRKEDTALVGEFFQKTMDIAHHLYPLNAKHFLKRRGWRIGTRTRREVRKPTEKEMDDLDLLYNVSKQLYDRLGITMVKA